MPVLKERTVILNGQTVTLLTPTERATKVGRAKASLEHAGRLLDQGAMEQARIAVEGVAAEVGALVYDDHARREHRRQARAK